MARTRAVDPFAGRRVSRPQRATKAPDPNAEVLAPGELARRVAAAMAARPVAEPTATELYERLVDAAYAEESPALDATEGEESPSEIPGDDGTGDAAEANVGDP